MNNSKDQTQGWFDVIKRASQIDKEKEETRALEVKQYLKELNDIKNLDSLDHIYHLVLDGEKGGWRGLRANEVFTEIKRIIRTCDRPHLPNTHGWECKPKE